MSPSMYFRERGSEAAMAPRVSVLLVLLLAVLAVSPAIADPNVAGTKQGDCTRYLDSMNGQNIELSTLQ